VTPPVALTVAGSDPCAGAGIQADLKTFAAHGVYGASVITALTAQNSHGVAGVFPVPADVVRVQLAAVLDDLPVAAVKVGMLATVEIADAVAKWEAALPNLVLDPVLISSSGFDLGARAAVERLLPFAAVVTPNVDEAAALVGWRVSTPDDMVRAASRIVDYGPSTVVITGGDGAVDLLWSAGEARFLRGRHVETRNTHGTGCTFSSAIAARLARGDPAAEAVAAAKTYVTGALAGAAGWRMGGGPHGPLDHLGKAVPPR
jgi:hydroxymethylpyrimidine/phosphomethylpyrimidine kinase